MYYLGALWLGGLFGWLACSMLVRHKLERENQMLRRLLASFEDGRALSMADAYERGKRDGSTRRDK